MFFASGRFDQLTQKNRSISISTALGEDVLLLRSFSGREEFSRLFDFSVELISGETDIDPKDIIGEQVIITLHGDVPRYFCGYVNSFTRQGAIALGAYGYQAKLVPWLWFLTQRTDCRVFQNKTTIEIVEEVILNLGFSDYVLNLVGEYEKIEYCVQYNESDFDFISRLLEHEGIYYYFSHENGKHTLVFCDHRAVHEYHEPKIMDHSSGSRASKKINDWQHQHQYFPGKLSQSDFNFEKFSGSLVTEREAMTSFKNAMSYELYHYPGEYKTNTAGIKLTTLRIEKEEVKYDRITAKSTYDSITVGKIFTLTSDEILSDNKKDFLVTRIKHHVSEGSYLESDTDISYNNELSCIPESINYRPILKSQKPHIDGVQTALVVGAKGDEICTDKYGRIKIQFPWDRYGKRNEGSSCWVRVTSQQAGKKWGVVGIPRVGNEVVVTFEGGNPNRPLVIGSVFNNENMPPINLPAEKTQTGMKSQSTKGGAGQNGFTVDDTKGHEGMNIHASYDCNFTVDNDMTTAIVNNDTYSVDVNLSETIGVDHTMRVGSNQSISVDGNQTKIIKGDQNISVDSNQTESVTGDQSISAKKQTVIIKTDQNIEAKNHNLTISADHNVNVGTQAMKVKGKQFFNVGDHETKARGKISLQANEINLAANSKITISVAGSSITIDAGKIELACGPSSVKVDMTGVTAKGPKITLN